MMCIPLSNKTNSRQQSQIPNSGLLEQSRHLTSYSPASCLSTPRASSSLQASSAHCIIASFFFPEWRTSATSCFPDASSTGNLFSLKIREQLRYKQLFTDATQVFYLSCWHCSFHFTLAFFCGLNIFTFHFIQYQSKHKHGFPKACK